jgi:hypothetical protein
MGSRFGQGIKGIFFGLDNTTLNTLLTNYTACLNAIATAGASYTIANRQFTRANLGEVSQMVAEINAALVRNAGSGTTTTYARFAN